jgi:hypothetical protein
MQTIEQALDSCKQQAKDEIISLRRPGTVPKLYEVLAECLRIVERCQASDADKQELHKLFMSRPMFGNRKYVQNEAAEYHLVTRYVFEPDDPKQYTSTTRAVINKYGRALRGAQARGIISDQLVDALMNDGGVSALAAIRQMSSDTITLSILRLRESIVVPRGKPFVLRLDPHGDLSYDAEIIDDGG